MSFIYESEEKKDLINELTIFSLEEINAIALEAKRKTQFIIVNGKQKPVPWSFFCNPGEFECRKEFTNESELKKEYRHWAKLLHPDMPSGNEKHFKRLECEYQAIIGNEDDIEKYEINYPREEW